MSASAWTWLLPHKEDGAMQVELDVEQLDTFIFVSYSSFIFSIFLFFLLLFIFLLFLLL